MAKTQQYFCPACRYAGAVEHEEHADVYTVINLMEDDHKRNRPHCEQGVRGMRVRNPGECSDQEWDQIISGGNVG
jgi:hypothetical protein